MTEGFVFFAGDIVKRKTSLCNVLYTCVSAIAGLVQICIHFIHCLHCSESKTSSASCGCQHFSFSHGNVK
jgi:heme/copper-type cytochrome/quinol oxidase subunit 4